MEVREIELRGHIIDSLILPRVFDTIMDMGGDFEVLSFRIGKRRTDPSYARILVKAESREKLDEILGELHRMGATVPEVEEARLEPAPADRVLPEGFYSTTNHPTYVLLDGEWVEVEDIEMDTAIVVEPHRRRARCKPISEIRKGELVVVGQSGIRVVPPERPREASIFEFMRSSVSSEKPVAAIISKVAEAILEVKAQGGKVLAVAGPAVVHTSAASALAWMIRQGYVDVLYAGNALAVHDIEAQLFHTSLGMDVETGKPSEGGHRNHLYAINEVMRAGGIAGLVRSGRLKGGIMYEVVRRGIPYVLAGSIRDDGPLPEVITDVLEAQREMRRHLRGVKLVLMLCTMLHSIAVGNLLPSCVRTICVDINPATVTKLTDRGTAQAMGIVSDVGVFLPMLVEELRRRSAGSSN